MPDQTVNAIVTSPPYWPAKRMYGGKGIGFEATLAEYLASLTTVFREARRVLKDTGVVWIVIDDSYAKAGGKWTGEGYLLKRPGRQKSDEHTGMGYQDCSWWRSSCGDVSSNSVASATLRRACDDCGAKKRSRRQTVRIRMAARVWFRGRSRLGHRHPPALADIGGADLLGAVPAIRSKYKRYGYAFRVVLNLIYAESRNAPGCLCFAETLAFLVARQCGIL